MNCLNTCLKYLNKHNLGLKVFLQSIKNKCVDMYSQNTSVASIAFDCFKTDCCIATGCFSYSKSARTTVNSGLCVSENVS